MESSISRRQAREQAFILAFETNFTDDSVADILEAAQLCGGEQVDPFAVGIVSQMLENREEIDRVIEAKAKGWRMNRISKVSLTILRLTVCQILFESGESGAKDPVSVAVSEAVRLSKKYSTPEDASFVNGVLGTVARAAGPAAEAEGQ